MSRYLAFLSWLVAFGQKLPAFLAALQVLLETLSPPEMVPTGGDSLQLVCDTTAMTEIGESVRSQVMEAEAKVANIVAGPNAAWDGTRVRRLFKFLKYSGLLDVLLTRGA